MTNETATPATCFNCDTEVVAAEAFCYGCKHYVCEECSLNFNLPFGGHEPEAHLTDPLEDEVTA